MDQPKYTTLTEALKSVPDPRHARGKRYSWVFLLWQCQIRKNRTLLDFFSNDCSSSGLD